MEIDIKISIKLSGDMLANLAAIATIVQAFSR